MPMPKQCELLFPQLLQPRNLAVPFGDRKIALRGGGGVTWTPAEGGGGVGEMGFRVGPFVLCKGEYQTRCARGACAVRVLGLFRRPFHPQPIRGNGNASRAHQVPFTTPLPVDHLLGKLFKYLTRCGRGARAVHARCARGADTPPKNGCWRQRRRNTKFGPKNFFPPIIPPPPHI